MNNTQVDNGKHLDTVMSIYSLLEYSSKYSKSCGILWQYGRDKPNANITDSESFKLKSKFTSNFKSNVVIAVPLKYSSNFWRTLEMRLINYEINLRLVKKFCQL